jgi:PAS domain S-box-containing protein
VTGSNEFASQPDVAALAVAEERYRALVRATSSLVWTSAPDGQIIDMPEWRAYTGMSVEQIKGWGWLDSLHPDDRPRTTTVWQQAVDARSLYETEYRIRRADGVYIWHQARGVPILGTDGSVREWVGLCVDIDLRKHADSKRAEAEMALRQLNDVLERRVEAEARERARIWNVSQDMLVVTDLDGRFLNLNPAWTTILGWPELDLAGKTFESLVHSDDASNTRAEVARLAHGNTKQQFENRLRHKDGSFRWLSWTAVQDRDRIYAVARDVTAIKAAEEELRSSRQELARVGRKLIMGAITASIAHEINQPLMAIATNANTALLRLSKDPADAAGAVTAIKRIVRDGLRAGQIVQTVRAMFKNDTEKKVLDANTVVRQVFALLRNELQKNNVLVTFELTDPLPRLLCDEVQLQQVILNLVMNAIEALSGVVDRPRTLRVKSNRSDPAGLILMLEDSGVGIDPEHADRVFEPFFSTKSDGMGMGLAICRAIIEAHGGHLTASPVHPHGTAFAIDLPANQ